IPLNHKGDTRTEVLRVILRETLLKKGSPSNSLPKTFSIKFSPRRALLVILPIITFIWNALLGLNSVIKSLEKGFGERTFPQKGLSPIITYKLLYKHRP
ncbi:hypothetical protein, partial [Ruminococcus flavefaciens]|uniref:hypothetical protein n=1 Tax=Ruminococcus flavefaciens TaxID=1265 RepID=UPI00048F2B1E